MAEALEDGSFVLGFVLLFLAQAMKIDLLIKFNEIEALMSQPACNRGEKSDRRDGGRHCSLLEKR